MGEIAISSLDIEEALNAHFQKSSLRLQVVKWRRNRKGLQLTLRDNGVDLLAQNPGTRILSPAMTEYDRKCTKECPSSGETFLSDCRYCPQCGQEQIARKR